LANQIQEWQEKNSLVLRRIEASMSTISRSIGTLSTALGHIQDDVSKTGGSSGSTTDTLTKLTMELKHLESALKEHMSGHVGLLSESLVGRGGFWRGIFLVVAFQAAGWVLYEMYRHKKDDAKKFI
jgi:hypothetical protein